MKVIVGKILAAHGIKGEVKVKSLSDNPRRYRRGSSIFIEKEGEYALITSVREADNDILIVKFKGVDDRTYAEKLRGSLLQVEEDQVPPLPEGEYYSFQLLGMEVFEDNGNRLGVLSDFVDSGANNVYQIDCENGDYLLLPAIDPVICSVDVKNKKMIVHLLPGLKEACLYHES
ncbi:MAG: 16S rRNA processing protein RimM [Firmicutes bacterium]|nr:16S rRNA processing protein RimM [Bacillota bacterium]